MKRIFVRYVSHEIRTPLNIVHMGIKLLRRSCVQQSSVDADHINTLADIEGSCETAIETLSELLDYEKLESGIMKLEKTKLAPWPLLRDSVKPFMIQVCPIIIRIYGTILLVISCLRTGSSKGS